MSEKVLVTMTSEMHQALDKHAKQRGASKAALMRIALSSWLQLQGDIVKPDMKWGGKRNGSI